MLELAAPIKVVGDMYAYFGVLTSTSIVMVSLVIC